MSAVFFLLKKVRMRNIQRRVAIEGVPRNRTHQVHLISHKHQNDLHYVAKTGQELLTLRWNTCKIAIYGSINSKLFLLSKYVSKYMKRQKILKNSKKINYAHN